MSFPDETEELMGTVVPLDRIPSEALTNLIQSYVLREGTDYGDREFSIDEKIAHVERQLQRGEVVVVFEPADETFSIVTQEVLRKMTV